MFEESMLREKREGAGCWLQAETRARERWERANGRVFGLQVGDGLLWAHFGFLRSSSHRRKGKGRIIRADRRRVSVLATTRTTVSSYLDFAFYFLLSESTWALGHLGIQMEEWRT